MGDLWLVKLFAVVPSDGGLWTPPRLVLRSHVSQVREKLLPFIRKIGVRFSRAAGKCELLKWKWCCKKDSSFPSTVVGSVWVCPAAPLPLDASPLLCSGWMSWRSHSCTVPKCHRGSCLPRKVGFAPRPQPASPVEDH